MNKNKLIILIVLLLIISLSACSSIKSNVTKEMCESGSGTWIQNTGECMIKNTNSEISTDIATSFLFPFLNMSTACSNGKTFREVIADCASTQRLDCLGRNSCDYLNDTINLSLLDSILTNPDVNYEFKVEHDRFILYKNLTYSKGCGPNSHVLRNSFLMIPLWPNRNQVVKVSMKICDS